MGMGFGSSPLELLATNAMLLGEIYCEMFSYSAVWLTGTNSALGANGTVDVQIQFNSDSDFICQELEFLSWSAAGTIIALPDYLLTMTVAGSGRQLQNQAQAIRLVAGSYATSDNPARLPFPRLFQMNTTLTNTLQNRTGTAANRAELLLRGFKVFYTGGSRQQIFHVS
jgi:hypothetical protein